MEQNAALSRVVDLFRSYDADGDGTMSREELEELFKAIDPGLDFDTLWAAVDTNGDGVVDYAEFVTWIMSDDVSDQTMSVNERAGSVEATRVLTSRPDDWEELPAPEFPALPASVRPQQTPMTAGPRRKGIYIRPAERCMIPCIFLWPELDGGAELEMKELDTWDDLLGDWAPERRKFEGIPGVARIAPCGPGAYVGYLAANRYMFRWSADGVPTSRPGRALEPVRKLGAALQQAAETLPGNPLAKFYKCGPKLLDELKKRRPAMVPKGLADEKIEMVREDIESLLEVRCSRQLPDRLAPLKWALQQIEDNTLYNMFEVKVSCNSELGFSKRGWWGRGWNRKMSLKEKAIMFMIRKAAEKKAEALALVKERGKRAVNGATDGMIKKLGLQEIRNKGFLDDLLNPLLENTAQNIERIPADMAGLQEKFEDDSLPGVDAETFTRWKEEDLSEEEQCRRLEDTYYWAAKTASLVEGEERSKLACTVYPVPARFYEVTVYLVFPIRQENRFSKATLHIWLEGEDESSKKYAMEEYWTGAPTEAAAENEVEEDEGGGGEEDEEKEEDAESADEASDAGEEPTWRGFCKTIRVLPRRIYCYRVVVDGKVYLRSTASKKCVSKYMKRFRVDVSIDNWGVNPLRELHLV